MIKSIKYIDSILQTFLSVVICLFIYFISFSQAPHTCDFQPGNPTSNDSQICFYSDPTTLMGCVMCQVTGQQIKCGAADDPYAGYYKVTYTGLTCFAPGVPLSVELIYFNALTQNEGILCFWSTASETDNDYFMLEKSENGFDFTPIAMIKGMGTTGSKSDYNYLDPNPNNGINYYKITQVDFNGAEKYYKPVSIRFYKEEKVNIASNPNNTGLFTLTTSKTIENIKITSSVGKTFYIDHPQQISTIDLSENSLGTYFLTIEFSDGEIETDKLVYAK